MTTSMDKSTRRVYSAEELHRLRGASSQPKLRESIEKHDSEDAELVKEHVLRGTKSFGATSFRSRHSNNSLRVPSNRSNNENFSITGHDIPHQTGLAAPAFGSVLSEFAPNGQILRAGPFKMGPSPTPSLKRKKAEAIVKAHGSPQHVRVTAGGRIVPSDQSPLCHPRFGYSAIQTNGGLIKFAPNYNGVKQQWIPATQDGCLAQDVNGTLCQIVDGKIMPVHTNADGSLILYVDAPNLNIKRSADAGPLQRSFVPAPAPQRQVEQIKRPAGSEPSLIAQIRAIHQEENQWAHDLHEINKTEALHGKSMGRMQKETLYSNRREHILKIDALRKSRLALEEQVDALRGQPVTNQPPPNAPTSPRAMRPSISPPGPNRLPPFLQTQQANVNMPAGNNGPGPMMPAPAPAVGNQFGPTPSPDGMFAGPPWAVPPPNVFVAPPQYDGSTAPVMAGYLPALPALPSARHIDSRVRDTASSLADISRSFTNAHIDPSANRTHAVSIKAPDSKSAVNLKSSLNPISPVYKPGVLAKNVDASKQAERVPLSLQQPRQGTIGAVDGSSGSDGTVSPAKHSMHLHSSSISSFGTADFFPNNPREYSTRQHAYPRRVDQSEPRKNTASGDVTPGTPAHNSTLQSGAPDTGNSKGPTAPPGTPVFANDANTQAPMPSKFAGPAALKQHHFDMPNRDANNVSPKAKREWVNGHEPTVEQNSSSPVKSHARDKDISEKQNDLIDPRMSREWVEGYHHGLQLASLVGESRGDFLEGYAEGLRYLCASGVVAASSELSTGSPMKTQSRRPSPALAPRTLSRLQQPEEPPAMSRPPFENSKQSLDTLKQAVLAPQNENTVLTPAADGPHVADTQLNPGARPKHGHAETLPGFPFPKRAVAPGRQGIMSEGNNGFSRQDQTSSNPRASDGGVATYTQPMSSQMAQPISPTTSTKSIASSSIASGSMPPMSNRISSVTSIDAGMYRQWPASRIMTPSEWKASSSVSHAAGLATGYFPPSQFDGAPQRMDSMMSDHGASRVTSGGRFREGSLDRITNPAMSPPPMSPTLSPNGTPRKDGSGKKKSNSPNKSSSPAKAKFEHMAEKMGIKVSGSGKPEAGHDGAAEPSSPRSKRSV